MDRFRLMPNYRYYNIEGTSPLTLDKAVGNPLRDYKIYGSADGVGDRSKNLFNVAEFTDTSRYSSSTIAKNVLVDGNKITISNTSAVQIRSDIFQFLKPNVAYSISAKSYTLEEGEKGSTTFRIALTSSKGASNFYLTYGTNAKARVLPEDLSDYDRLCLFGSTNGVISFDSIQIEESSIITEYEPYYDGYRIPITVNEDEYNIYLDEPLLDGEYLDHINQKLVKVDTEADISLPTIKTHTGTNIITVGTTVPASNIAVQYYK